MLKRIITAVVGLVIIVPIFWFSDFVTFPILFSFGAVVCLYEMFKCMGLHKKLYLSIPVYLFGAACPFLVRYMSPLKNVAFIGFIFAVVYLIYLFSCIVWSHGKLQFTDAITLYAMCLYIILGICCVMYIRFHFTGGEYLYLLIFLGAWVTDIFAYFTGMLIGKHKLIPDVSPKKTIEGSIGGIVFCALFFVGYGFAIEKIFSTDINLLFLGISGVIISIISQIGDLIMSVIKRYYNVKDFGKILPGHGGILDRIDSMLAVSVGLGAIGMFITLTGISIV